MYTVSSAYKLSKGMNIICCIDKVAYTAIWKLCVPEKTRAFIWLAFRGSILTNEERRRRHLTKNADCPLCCNVVESLIHLFRDCPKAKSLWSCLHSSIPTTDFFILPFSSWIHSNLLSKKTIGDGVAWSSLFALAIWWPWRWRNEEIFNNKNQIKDGVSFVLDRAREYRLAWEAIISSCNAAPRRELFISWERLIEDWVEVNTDGSVNYDNCALAGGVICDSYGRWVCGFAHNLGHCMVPMPELWGF